MAGPWDKYKSAGPINSGVNPTTVTARQNADRGDAQFEYQIQRDRAEDARRAEEDSAKRAMAQGAQQDAAEQLQRTIAKLDSIKKDATDSWTGVAGLGETGWSGWAQSGIPGSAAYSLRKDLKTIDATQVLQAMTRLKELSPTGSTGFGALSAPELELLRSSVANLDPDMDQETFMNNLEGAKKVYQGMLQRIQSAQKPAARKAPPSDIQAIMRKYGAQ